MSAGPSGRRRQAPRGPNEGKANEDVTARSLVFCGVVSTWCASVAWGSPATAPAGGLSAVQKRQLASLKLQATGRDFDKALEAIGQIEAMGPAARDGLAKVLKGLLSRCEGAIESAARAAGPRKRTAPIEKKLAAARAEALANLKVLKKNDPSMLKANAYNQKLLVATNRFSRTMRVRSRLVDALGHRLKLLAVLRRVAGGASAGKTGGKNPGPSPMQRAEEALGVSLEKVASIDDLRAQPSLKGLFAYRLNRRTAAYNRQVARALHGQEAQNAVMVNAYREVLGLLQLEIDVRLAQSARRHSKEMVELGYFSHTSPTKGSEGFADRVRNAGYPSPGGENIALGRWTGAQVFQQWFGSPGHHQNMVRAQFTAIGVGKWGTCWTQNFGTGKRLADADEATRKAVKIKGRALLPQR